MRFFRAKQTEIWDHKHCQCFLYNFFENFQKVKFLNLSNFWKTSKKHRFGLISETVCRWRYAEVWRDRAKQKKIWDHIIYMHCQHGQWSQQNFFENFKKVKGLKFFINFGKISWKIVTDRAKRQKDKKFETTCIENFKFSNILKI